MEIKIEPVAVVTNKRLTPTDDFWGDIISEITLLPHIPTEAFDGVGGFSHLEIIYFFNQAEKEKIIFSGRPRENPLYPVVGIFGQRKKDRPNQLGLCTVELIEHSKRTIKIKHFDAINGTPILDIKPVFEEYQFKGKIQQPVWVTDLMKNYWK